MAGTSVLDVATILPKSLVKMEGTAQQQIAARRAASLGSSAPDAFWAAARGKTWLKLYQ